MNRKLLVSALALLLVRMMIGCGAPAAPEPPSLNLPLPVLNLSAVRIGDSVHLAWTMPTRTTDHVALKHPITVQVCRGVESGPCTNIGSLNLAPGAAGTYMDGLPPELTRGPDRLLHYEVVLANHAGKSAGPSNAAYSAAGTCPAALNGLSGRVRSDGVLLSWTPAAEGGRPLLFRIQRKRVNAAAGEETHRSLLTPDALPAEQTMEVHSPDGIDPGHAIDNSALFNQRYEYLVERVASLTLFARTIEIEGTPSEAIAVTTIDVFPPAVPQGLVAVADGAGGAIDLSWSPDSESDLAGYRVYRREVAGNLPAQGVASPGVETSYRDVGIKAEHTYAYSVSAVDQSGNESKPSPEVEETLPRP